LDQSSLRVPTRAAVLDHDAAPTSPTVLGARRTDKLDAIVKGITLAGGQAKAFT
jgi:hypothetical protein